MEFSSSQRNALTVTDGQNLPEWNEPVLLDFEGNE
jgi:hypothetical protein